jgi:MFS family permease
MSYRAVLQTPGLRVLTVVGFLARIPANASGVVLTLHVVLTLRLGYGAAGLVAAATTVGMAIGSPLLGRMIDRSGLRPVVALTVVTEVAFWSVAPLLPYPGLLVGAFLGGLLGLPVYSLIRQATTALVADERRRTAFALDAMSVELSYIVGPAAGTVLALQLSTGTAMWLVGAGWVAGGVTLWVLDPPTRAPEGKGTVQVTGPVRSWVSRRLGGALLGTAAAVLLLFGTELVMIASLQTSGQQGAIPVVNAVWCLSSLTGGFVFGLIRRPVPLAGLVAGLAVATAPVAIGGPWWAFALLLVPAGLLCAPALTASAETVSMLAPEHARGLVMGLHGSAITLGGAIATPLAGLLIDRASPATAVLAVAAAGGAAALVAATLMRARDAPVHSASSQRPEGRLAA